MSRRTLETAGESSEAVAASVPSGDSVKTPRLPKVRCQSIGAVSEFLKAMANPVRLSILCVLMEGARTVGELETILGVHQPTMSQQLGALREAGLIQGRRNAREVAYRLADPRSGQIIGHLRLLFPDPAASPVWRGTSLELGASTEM